MRLGEGIQGESEAQRRGPRIEPWGLYHFDMGKRRIHWAGAASEVGEQERVVPWEPREKVVVRRISCAKHN